MTTFADAFRQQFGGRVALIAGGTGALGRDISLAFLELGAHVVVTYRRREEFDVLAADAQTQGLTAPVGVALDTSDAAAVSAAVERLATELGRLDVLVNAVGGYAGGTNVWETDAAVLERMMAVNLVSGFALSRAAVPVMIRQNRGWIVNVASRAGYGHSAGAALYSASKAGALALFDSLAEEVKPYAINVNSVVPSIFDTPANRRAMPSANYAVWPKPSEIARVIVFLCSDEARVIHGAAIPVYGRT